MDKCKIIALVFLLKQFVFSQITLSNSNLKRVADLSSRSDLNQILDHLLVDRSIISPNHRTVEEYIKKFLFDLGWSISEDEFSKETPLFGKARFNNIIATLNPNSTRQLVLACHYDSKYFPGENFVGATDSAVPCAMMMALARSMRDELDATRVDMNLQLIFFDGEEAIKQWTGSDSLYGANHLASRWEDEQVLDKIDLLVLLDLIGAANPEFYSFFEKTDRWFNVLKEAEHRLDVAGKLCPSTKDNRYFKGPKFGAHVQDDHIPFSQRNVPILHLIPNPFPKVWHTLKDDKKAIDLNTIQNLIKILSVFVAEYLRL